MERLEDRVDKLEGTSERQTRAIEGIEGTLKQMASDEIADLRRRAELPRRILLAVAVPVFVGVIIATAATALSGLLG